MSKRVLNEAFFKLMGKRGGKARAKKLSPERRKEIAQLARAAQLKGKTV